MHSYGFTSGLVALAAFVGDANAFFRINCGRILDGRIDPIISPGKVSGHLHTLVGSASTLSQERFDA